MFFLKSVQPKRLKHLLTILPAVILLSSCSGVDQITPIQDGGTSVNVDDIDTPESLYAYSSSSTLSPNSYTYIVAQGGQAPYTYSLISGDATVNSSTGYVQIQGSGNITIRVQDSSGSTYQVQLNVSGETSAPVACVYLGSKTQMQSGAVESIIDLTSHSVLSKHVITGIGLRLHADSLAGIYSKVSVLNADGTIASNGAYSYATGDLGAPSTSGGTAKGEIYIDLPSGYFLTGLGFAPTSNGSNLQALKVYGAKVNASGSITDRVECLVDNQQVSGCWLSEINLTSKNYYNRYSEIKQQGASPMPLVSWGAKVTSGRIESVNAAGKSITASTTADGSCGQ